MSKGVARVAKYAILGDPVAHSLSPTIHAAAFRAGGRRAVYTAMRVDEDECGRVMRALALDGGGGNVTVPYKETVVPFLDRCTTAVSETGACNTFWAKAGEVWGDNTDVEGFLALWRATVSSLRNRLPTKPDVLVLGAGGAARAVVFGLLDSAEAGRILVWNRTCKRGRRLVRHFADGGLEQILDWRESRPHVVVNATSAGLYGFGTPIDLRELKTRPLALIDLVYCSEATPICREATELVIRAADGREMLIRQAEAAYRRWFGEPAPPGVMKKALR